jgi:hypothetical protein
MRIIGSHKYGDASRPLKQATWHEPSLGAEESEFFITNTIGPGCIKVVCDEAPAVAISRAQSTSRSQGRTQDIIQSSLPRHIVDAVRAKFMQTPHATQFFDIQCVADCAMIFGLDRKAEGFCVVCKREHSRKNAYLELKKPGAIFMHCHRATDSARTSIELYKEDFVLAVDIKVAMTTQVPYGLPHADILDDAHFLTHNELHLAPPLESLKLGQGKLDIQEQQPAC